MIWSLYISPVQLFFHSSKYPFRISRAFTSEGKSAVVKIKSKNDSSFRLFTITNDSPEVLRNIIFKQPWFENLSPHPIFLECYFSRYEKGAAEPPDEGESDEV
ncbi:uncharacterized protein LOC111064888 [Drosophila obscura]|uniref:uncharacterized protein LOC111064888 n=1 Tax=Drosophila obscura TaxID=7282 RepID=UPI001BB18105|nr:uncharacterized protein LOC111064888 [Drosophila obscura]